MSATAAPSTKAPALRHGDDHHGCVVVRPAPLMLRCPCDATFEPDELLVKAAARLAQPLKCPGCSGEDAARREAARDLDRQSAPPARGTATESLMRAAWAAFGAGEFSTWDMVVAAFKADPDRWSLPGYVGVYPDSNRVKVELCQAKTRTRTFGRYLERVGPNRHRLSVFGRMAAKKLLGGR